jgi:hypothetical protein
MQSKDQTIHSLMEHLGDLEQKRNKFVQEVEREIEHVKGTIASLRKTDSVAREQQLPLVSDFPIGKIRNMTQVQALVTIAKHQDGVIRAQEAKRLLIRAGVMRQTKNSTNIIHAVIVRSDRFAKVRPGEYRLKDSPPKTEEEHTLRQSVQ